MSNLKETEIGNYSRINDILSNNLVNSDIHEGIVLEERSKELYIDLGAVGIDYLHLINPSDQEDETLVEHVSDVLKRLSSGPLLKSFHQEPIVRGIDNRKEEKSKWVFRPEVAQAIVANSYSSVSKMTELKPHEWFTLQVVIGNMLSSRTPLSENSGLQIDLEAEEPKELPNGAIYLNELKELAANYLEGDSSRTRFINVFKREVLKEISSDFYGYAWSQQDHERYHLLKDTLKTMKPTDPLGKKPSQELRALENEYKNGLFITREGIDFLLSSEANLLLKVRQVGEKTLTAIKTALSQREDSTQRNRPLN